MMLCSLLIEVAELVVPQRNISIIERSPADNRILECAVEGRAEFIVTGDKRDLGKLKTFEGIKIVSPSSFRSIFARGGT